MQTSKQPECICRSRFRFGLGRHWQTGWMGELSREHRANSRCRRHDELDWTGLGCCGSGQILTNAPLNAYYGQDSHL